jgi:hypothetical protein
MTMPLALPDLDDRRWTDLVAEGRSLIPLYAPGWTDHNVHDPGITLIELLAWVAEMDLYQVNRIPAERVRKLLALAGVTPHPPRAARTVLALTGKAGAPLPAGTRLEARDLAGGWMPWRTLEPVTPASLRLEAVQAGGAAGFEDLTARWLRGEAIALCGEDPAAGSALYLGFDWQMPPDQPVSLWLRFSGPGTDDDERARIAEEAALAHAACHPPLLPCHCGCHGSPSSPGGGGWEGTGEEDRGDEGPGWGARTVWEVLAGPGLWRPLDPQAGEVVDDTRSLTLDGRVLVKLSGAVKARVGAVREELHYLRCRLAAGAWDAAPRLVNLAVNGVRAEQAKEVSFTSQGNGAPFQQLALPEAPVADAVLSFESLESLPSLQSLPWEARPDFDGSGRASAHFLLDPTEGIVTVGDGENGRTIPEGVEVRARYRATLATAGNLPAGRTWRFTEAALNAGIGISNPLPAMGGAGAETLAAASARAADLVNRPFRAVTLGDCERLARETPGVRLARATARAGLDPALPCFVSPGVISVLVMPFLPRRRPVPSPGLLRAVASYLGRRRVIGTRIEVFGPSYLEVAVRARVRAFPGVPARELAARVTAALDRFFDPLEGGPEGGGWPFGRDVYRSEVLQVIDETPGVDCVLSLELIAAGGPPSCGNVCLGPTTLVAAGTHAVEVA